MAKKVGTGTIVKIPKEDICYAKAKLEANVNIMIAVLKYEHAIADVRLDLEEAGMSADDIDEFIKERSAVAKQLSYYEAVK